MAVSYEYNKKSVELIDNYPILKNNFLEIRNIQKLEQQKVDIADKILLLVYESYGTVYNGFQSETAFDVLKNLFKYNINEKKIESYNTEYEEIKPKIIKNIKSLFKKNPIKGSLKYHCKKF